MLPDMHEPDSPYLKPRAFARWYVLDYFRRPGRRVSLQTTLIVAAVVPCAIWVAWSAAPGNRGAFTSGPLSAAHATHAGECSHCHTRWFGSLARLLDPQARSVADGACAACHPHQAEPPVHHDQAGHRDCAGCHREHRDRPYLALVGDHHCTRCHSDLERLDRQKSPFGNVTAFPGGHPEFNVPVRDTAHIHFSHEAHLRSTGVLGPNRRQMNLQCGSCHQPDASGHYMQSINFERHCAECHPLSVQVLGDGFAGGIAIAAQSFSRLPAPHRDPATVRAALMARYTGFAQAHPDVVGRPLVAVPERMLPGKQGIRQVAADAPAWIAAQLEAAERRLFTGAGGCRFCHVSQFNDRPTRGQDLPTYAPTGITNRWLKHAWFNHASTGHRQQQCTDCHPAPASRAASDVLLPRLAKCGECHTSGGTARADCIECHRYHRVPGTGKDRLADLRLANDCPRRAP